MRKGQNPAKYIDQVVKPQRITVAILNFIPMQSGFFANMKAVLTACIESSRKDAGLPFDLLVFDNGSCVEIREYLKELQDKGIIQYLILSEKNLGKGGAWNIILNAAPGEIIAYADNDVLFKPGWLARSVEILETYPRVGMVTARPFRTREEYYSATLSWAKKTKGVRLESGQILPLESLLEFDRSLGQSDDEISERYQLTRDFKLSYKGVVAFAGGSHWQFTAYKKTLGEFLPFQMEKPMGQVKMLDQRINDSGYLRLMVGDELAMNMSNNLPAGSSSESGLEKSMPHSRILDFPPIRKILLGIYDAIFRIYYDQH